MRNLRGKVHRNTARRVAKARRTFTLSPESVALLEELSTARRGSRRRSVSAVLDDLLQALNDRRRREALESAISAYYDELPPEDRSEEAEWGNFSLAQFMEGTD